MSLSVTDRDPIKDFAILIPANKTAKSAFDAVCRKIDAPPEERYGHPYHLEQIARTLHRSPSQSPVNVSSFGSTTDEASSGFSSPHSHSDAVAEAIRWSGCYVFKWSFGSESSRGVWCAGTGRSFDKIPSGNVDILLATDSSGGVRSRHAIFQFTEDGIFTVTPAAPRRAATLRVDAQYSATHDPPVALTGKGEFLITFGEQDYIFRYVDFNKDQAIQRNAAFSAFLSRMGQPAPNTAVSGSPSSVDAVIGDYTIHAIVGRTQRTIFQAASSRKGGRVLAYKAISPDVRTPDASAMVDKLKVLKGMLKGTDNAQHVMQLEDLITIEDARGASVVYHLFFIPLVRCDFGGFCHPKRSEELIPVREEERRALFQQVLHGLTALHSIGWVHRDIKPKNLGVKSFNPPTAVILDLDQAVSIRQLTSEPQLRRPGGAGTIGYLAPEMESGECDYNQLVDIWAAGCVGMLAFDKQAPWISARRNPWRDEHRDDVWIARYKDAWSDLAAQPSTSLDVLLANMLADDPKRRISAAKAALHPSLCEDSTASPGSPSREKKRRVDAQDSSAPTPPRDAMTGSTVPDSLGLAAVDA